MLRTSVLIAAFICLIALHGMRAKAGDAIEVDLSRLLEPTEQGRQQVGDSLLNIEAAVLQADRIGVVATGEYFIGAQSSRSQRINAFRFGYSWCIDHEQDRERLAYSDQSIVDPIMLEGPKTRVMTNTSNSYDRLRLARINHEAVGTTLRSPNETSFVARSLKRRGVFFPLMGTLDTAMGLYTGQRFKADDAGLKISHCVGVRRFGDTLQAEFEYRPVDAMVYLRVISFRDEVPVQVDDYVGYDLKLKKRDPRKKWEADYEELMELHQIVKPKARTFTTWKKKGELRLPTSIHSMTLTGPNAVELKVKFRWKLNEEVPESAFALETVGQVGPLAIVPE